MNKQVLLFMKIAVASLALALPGIEARAADSKPAQKLGHVEKAANIIGQTVQDSSKHNLGKIEDVVLDLESGRVLYAIVSTGGVLGLGDHLMALAPGVFVVAKNGFLIKVDRARFAGAPTIQNNETNLGSLEFVAKVHQYFGQSEWWRGPAGSNAATGSFHNVHKASELKGMNVQNVSNQNISDVENVMIDLPAGRVVYVVIAPDKSLNLGDNFYVLPPNALTLSSDKKSLVTGVTRERLAAGPHFSRNQWPDMSNPSFAAQVYQYYGKRLYFEPVLQPTSTRSNGLERIYHEPGESSR